MVKLIPNPETDGPFWWCFTDEGQLLIAVSNLKIGVHDMLNIECVFFTNYGTLLIPPNRHTNFTEEEQDKLQLQLETALVKAYDYLEAHDG